MFRDLNGDGWPDIYVCNDMDSVDRIWINRRDGRFQAIDHFALRHTPLASMGIDFADINRDGKDDFFIVDMLAPDHVGRQTLLPSRTMPAPPGVVYNNRPQYMRNALYLNRGDGSYAEIAQLAGLDASDWSWMPLFLDVDLDGYEDVLITTGIEQSIRDADARERLDKAKAGRRLSRKEFFDFRRALPKLDTPNHAYRNRGDLTFEETGAAWGFDSRQSSHGMALADLDNDGDLDVVINCMNGPALIYRNGSVAPRVAVRLKGREPNTRGIGAKIRFTGGPVPQSQEMIAGGRYLSGDDAMRVFAAGRATNGLALEVTWRSGRSSVVADVKPNRVYEIDETSSAFVTNPPPAPQRKWFSDASSLIQHIHVEDHFNDFTLQPLITRRLSHLGPGVCWCDINGDGRSDLVVAAARGGEAGVFLNTGGGFERIGVREVMGRLPDDQTAVVGWRSASGVMTLVLGLANYESATTNDPPAMGFQISTNGVGELPRLPGQEASAGPLAVGDLDGNGHLALFVGGRVVGGRYPKPASSRLFRFVSGRFELDVERSRIFENVGLVSGAVFTDLTGDGLPELVLACEWGPLKIFRNERGRLEPWNCPIVSSDPSVATFNQLTGWWNSIAAGDFDGDGRMDLVAGNWGRNDKHRRYLGQGLRVYYGDLNEDGIYELLQAYHDPPLNKLVPAHYFDTVARMMPWVREKITSYRAYSTSGVQEVFGERFTALQELGANTFDSMVFLNRGGRFEARPLPIEAQFSPIFGLCVGDLDGDGREDIFASQNFFGVDPETSRYDAGRGLVLQGDGRGGFRAVPAAEAGLAIDGEGRGAALADFDNDGRVDLAAAQGGSETKLYRNEHAQPGLRVRVVGTDGDVGAIGAVLRPVNAAGSSGPAREIRAGSGYWSQDSFVQVLGDRTNLAQLWIRWPGGRTNLVDVPPQAMEISLDAAGKVQVVR